MRRRDVLKGAALLPALTRLNFAQNGTIVDQVCFPESPTQRLNQGPFDVEQDQGWQTILFTTPSEKPLRNPGLGLVGYTWEESGPSLAARAGRETLEQHVEKISSLPFVDVLYIRCDWRNVQSRAGRLDLDPVWALTMDAAKRKGLRVSVSNSVVELFFPAGAGCPSSILARANSAGKNRAHPGPRATPNFGNLAMTIPNFRKPSRS